MCHRLVCKNEMNRCSMGAPASACGRKNVSDWCDDRKIISNMKEVITSESYDSQVIYYYEAQKILLYIMKSITLNYESLNCGK